MRKLEDQIKDPFSELGEQLHSMWKLDTTDPMSKLDSVIDPMSKLEIDPMSKLENFLDMDLEHF